MKIVIPYLKPSLQDRGERAQAPGRRAPSVSLPGPLPARDYAPLAQRARRTCGRAGSSSYAARGQRPGRGTTTAGGNPIGTL